MTTPPITSWHDIAPAIVAIRQAAYVTARDERLPLVEYVALERRLVRQFALQLLADGHAAWCARVLPLHGR